jgi:signal transduction histidine kinase
VALDATRVVFANTAFLRLLGLSREEAEGLPADALVRRVLPEARPWLESAYHPAAPAGAVREEWTRLPAEGGGEHTYCVRLSEGPRAGEQLMVLVAEERAETARRLTVALTAAAAEMTRCREEREVLELAVEAVHRQGLWAVTILLEGEVFAHGPLRHAPDALAASEQLYGMPLHQVRFPRAQLPHLQEVVASGKAVFHPDLHGLADRLHPPPVAAMLRRLVPSGRGLDAPVFVEGEPYCVLSVQGEPLSPTSVAPLELFARSVGSALENVRHHRRAREQLEQVEQLQQELLAQEGLTALGEAAAAVAHEVRNPLAAMLNAVAVLKRERGLGPAGASAAAMLEEEAVRLEGVVRDLLEVVRPLSLAPEPLLLEELVDEAVARFQEELAAAGLRVQREAPGALPRVPGDRSLVLLAVENLLRNALQASPPGGALTLALREVPQGVALEVRDEGVPVHAAGGGRDFDPFQASRASGTGLGLAVVRRVAQALGGEVRVEPGEARGACFVLTLPALP